MSSRLLLIAKTTSHSRFYSSLFDLSCNTLRFTPFRMAWGSHNLRKSIRPSDKTTPLGHSPQAYYYNLLFDGAELYRHYSLRLSLIFFFFGLSPEFFFCHLLWFHTSDCTSSHTSLSTNYLPDCIQPLHSHFIKTQVHFSIIAHTHAQTQLTSHIYSEIALHIVNLLQCQFKID